MTTESTLQRFKEKLAVQLKAIPLHQIVWLIQRSRTQTMKLIRSYQEDLALMHTPEWEPLPQFAGDSEYLIKEKQIEKIRHSLATEIKLLTLLDTVDRMLMHIDGEQFAKDVASYFRSRQ